MHSISDMWYWLNAIVAGGFIRFFSFLGIGYLTFHLYECAEKMFKISDKLSAVALLSGEARFGGEDIKNFITKYLSKTDIDKINSTLNRCNSKSSSKRDVNDYIKKTFPYFESIIKNLNQNSLMDFLKNHSLKDSIDVKGVFLKFKTVILCLKKTIIES